MFFAQLRENRSFVIFSSLCHLFNLFFIFDQVALLPRYYGYQRTDQIKVTSPNSTLRERLTFEFVKDDDISLMSLEVVL